MTRVTPTDAANDAGGISRSAAIVIVFAIALVAVVLPHSRSDAASVPTRFGIEYFLWHCLAATQPNYDVGRYEAGKMALGPANSFHWWGKPKAGYYCLSQNDALLRQHAQELAQAGVDFIFIDFSNHDSLAYEYVHTEYLDPLDRLLAVWSQLPNAPKVVPFAQVTPTGDLYEALAQRLEQHPELEFRYEGKPLFLIVSNTGVPVDPQKRQELDKRFTTRLMWDDFSPPGTWMFISRCRRGFLRSRATADCRQRVAVWAGEVEQVSVAAAFQRDYMSDKASAVPRFGGRTFLKQMARLDELPPVPIVTILGWNQWMAQRLCVKADLAPDPACAPQSSPLVNGNPVFTDAFDQEYSNDFEPGGAAGDAYYRLLACEVQRRKSGDRTQRCPLPAAAQ